MPQKPSLLDYLHLHVVVLVWGFTAILGLLADSISTWGLIVQRTFWAAAGLGLLMLIRRQPVRLAGADRLRLLGVGAILAVTWLSFFGSARVANASVSLVGLATASLWCSLLEPLFFRRAVRPLEVVLGVVAVLGLGVIFRADAGHALGLGLALLTALLAALATILSGQFVQRVDAVTIMFYEMLGATITSLLLALLYQQIVPTDPVTFWPTDPADWGWILMLALVCTVYAHTAATWLMKKFSPFAINLTVNLEPVYGIGLAVLIFGKKEVMPTSFYLGTAIILTAVLAYPILNRLANRIPAADDPAMPGASETGSASVGAAINLPPAA
jgi:drug/metabolite transporter (DMT)-like permease